MTDVTHLPHDEDDDEDPTFDESNSITLRWHIRDVQSERADLTDVQAFQVLKTVEKKFDANIGVNWNIIRFWADQLFPLKREDG